MHSGIRRNNGRVTQAISVALILSIASVLNVASAKPTVVRGDDAVIASRGGVNLTLAELDARIMELPASVRAEYLNSPVRIEETIGGLLLEKQLAAKAYELGADQDPYLQLQIEQTKTRFLAARARKLNEEKMEVPDFTDLATEAYLANPEKYSTQETLDLSHVLISERGRSEEDALKRANEVRRLAASGERTFQSLVDEYTDEGRQGQRSTGQLRGVVHGMMEPSFEEVAFALKNPGDISEVVKTRYGYHVILLEGREEAKKLPYERVESRIVEELRKNYIEKNKSSLPDALRSMPIEADKDVVASLVTRYTPAGPKGERVSEVAPNPAAAKSTAAASGSTPR